MAVIPLTGDEGADGLAGLLQIVARLQYHLLLNLQQGAGRRQLAAGGSLLVHALHGQDAVHAGFDIEHAARSEERRVGKECRSRWAPDQEDKKRVEEEWMC